MVSIDIHQRALNVNIEAEEMVRRRDAWKPPKPRYISGWLARYARFASNASTGAIQMIDPDERVCSGDESAFE